MFIEQFLMYPAALIMSNERKTCESMAKIVSVAGDKLLRYLQEADYSIDRIIESAKHLFGNKKIYLLIDDTLISKRYSKYIAGTSNNFDSSLRQTYKSICSITAMLTDGTYAIPLDQKIWTNKEVSTSDYKKKSELAQELIASIASKINIEVVVMDGLYATVDMIKFLNNSRQHFEMRMHANRTIRLTGSTTLVSLRECAQLRLKPNQFQKTISAYWHDILVTITAVKRVSKNGTESVVYQVSNYKASPKKHVKIYSLRWSIEKFFRTAKQSLGLTDCQSRKLQNQINHIKSVFFAYTALQFDMKKSRLKTPEEALRRLRFKNNTFSNARFNRLERIFGLVCA